MRRLVALYRSPAYSPNQHRQNDRAILDAVVDHLSGVGWRVVRANEEEIVQGRLPAGDLYLNMCQGPAASALLQQQLPAGAVCINTPEAVLSCHRHRLVSLLRGGSIAFPATVVISTSGPEAEAPPVHLVTDNGYPVWLKRGDLHAQTADDVIAVRVPELRQAISCFAGRGIPRVALQAHVLGPVIKFYGVIGREFFHCYPAEAGSPPDTQFDELLQELAERAAQALALAVYGGDAVLTASGTPVLIDLNDWPSFAPVRASAAAAIARFANRRALSNGYSCSTP
jgi:hypothetical protein